MADWDLVIRGGQVFDGRGGEPQRADIAIKDGRIAAVGTIPGTGRDEISADGRIVTPGFVDIHTHYDGHATWGERLAPSSSHGVTTVVMGNCGVGFAPCRPEDRDDLIRLMEGVEDIPGVVMAEGIPWQWQTFPEFLDFLARRRFDVDVAAQLPHAPLRVWVMGQRGLNREPATAADMAEMRRIAAEAISAGAIGVATSRSLNHRSSTHQLMPNVSAAEGELVALGMGVRDAGTGVLQAITDFDEPEADFQLLRRVVERTGVPLSFSLMQAPHAPDRYRRVLEMLDAANDAGVPLKAQVCTRPVGALLGLALSFHMFSFSPSYREIAHLPLDERLRLMHEPERRAAIVAEWPTPTREVIGGAIADLDNIFVMGAEPRYEPAPESSIGGRARAMGVDPRELAYDLLIDDEGSNVFYVPAMNFVGGSTAAVEDMLRSENTLVGLGDGGAHVGIVCDASLPTSTILRWALAGGADARPLARVIEWLTSRNAAAVNLRDRGVVAPGYRADLNIINLDRLALARPTMIRDLPDGSARLHQDARGYAATIVNGVVTYRNGEATGELPGRLVRGAQTEPAPAD